MRTRAFRNVLPTLALALLWLTTTQVSRGQGALEHPVITSFTYRFGGSSVVFEVTASGGGLAYQWYWQGQPIQGANGPSLAYTNAAQTANAGYYSVRIWNAFGEVWSPDPGLLFTRALVPGTYQALIYDEFDPTPNSSGLLKVTVSQSRRSYSGMLLMNRRIYRFSGVFQEDHASVARVVSSSGAEPVGLTLQLLTANGTPSLSGEVSLEAENRYIPFKGHRAAYNSHNPAPQAGRYTVAFHETNVVHIGQSPDGTSYASVIVSATGGVALSGRAADGTPIYYSRGNLLSKNGEWPLYIPLHENQGLMAGWLAFTNVAGNTVPGQIVWMKPGLEGQAYPDGFTITLESLGSTYITGQYSRDWKQPGIDPLIPFEYATATFTGGDMFSDDLSVWSFVDVAVPTPGKFRAQNTPEKLGLSINPNTGVIWGTFVNFVTGQVTPVRGVLLQNQGTALGFFLSQQRSGYFALEPKLQL